jgi:WD40 repeat protein
VTDLPATADGLVALIEHAAPGGAVLTVDGLEELFTLCGDTRARDLFAAVLVQIAARGRHLLILTIRSAWMTDLATLSELYVLVQKSALPVPPLAALELRKAITAPAERVGLTFEERLAESLANDFLNEPPALLQLALVSLWQRRNGARVTWRAYAELGRGRALVSKQAESLQPIDGSRDVIQNILLAFIDPGVRAGQTRTRRLERRTLLELRPGDAVAHTLDRLVAAHLLRTSASNAPGDIRYEWLHDVLKDAVPAIGDWLHARELEEARALAERERRRADEEERLRHEEARLRRKARHRAWAFGIAAAIAFLLAVATLRELSRREILLMASASERLAPSNPDLAVALAALALDRSDTNVTAIGAAYKAYFASATGRVASTGAPIAAVAVASDNRYAVVGDKKGAVVAWDLEEARSLWSATLDPSDRGVSAIAVSPAGDIVMVGSDGGTVSLYSSEGRLLVRSTHHGQEVHAVVFNADGSQAASGGGDDQVWWWQRANTPTGEWRRLDRGGSGHGSSVRALAFSGDSRLLFSGEEDKGVVIAWDLSSAQPFGRVETLPGGTTSKLRSAAASPTGCSILVGADDGTLTLIDVGTAFPQVASNLPSDCQRAAFGPVRRAAGTFEVTSVAFGRDGHYAVSGSEGWNATLWRVAPGSIEPLKTFRGHSGPIESVIFQSPDAFVSGSDDGTVRVWALDAGLEVARLTEPAASADGATSSGDARRVRHVALSTDGRSALAAYSVPNRVHVDRWDIAAATSTRVISERDQAPFAALDPEGVAAITHFGRGVAVSDLSSQRKTEYGPFVPPPRFAALGGGTAAWITDDDSRLFVVGGGEAKPRELSSLQEDATRDDFVMAVSADGRRIAVGTPTGRVWLFDTQATDGAPVRSDPLHIDAVTAVAFDRAGETLASASRDGTIMLWDLIAQARVRLRGHTTAVHALAFTPDGRFLLSGADGQDALRLWHVASRLVVHTFEGGADVRAAAISSDGRQAITGNTAGTLRVWTLPDLASKDLLGAIRTKRWVRDLTGAELREFGLSPWLDIFYSGRRRP